MGKNIKKRNKGMKVNYYRGDGIVEIFIRDETGRREDKFTANQSDRKSQARIGCLLKDKYDIDFSPTIGVFDF